MFVDKRSVVVNVADTTARIAGHVPGTLPCGRSTILEGVEVAGDYLILIEPTDSLTERDYRDAGWLDFYPQSQSAVLLQSPQAQIKTRLLDVDMRDPAQNSSGSPWSQLYYKENYAPLQRIKETWDPHNHVRHSMSIEPSKP